VTRLGCISWKRRVEVVPGRSEKKNNPMSSFPTILIGRVTESGDSSSSNLCFPLFCFSLSSPRLPSSDDECNLPILTQHNLSFSMYSSDLYCNITIVIEDEKNMYIFFVLRAICTSAMIWNQRWSATLYWRWLRSQLAVTCLWSVVLGYDLTKCLPICLDSISSSIFHLVL
jgi:hypothetical protein